MLLESFAYWTVHHLHTWIKVDQLDVTILLCQFTAQHVSDVNTPIFRSLQLLGVLLQRLYCAGLRHVGVMLWTGCWWCGIQMQVEPLLSSSTCIQIPHHQQPIRYITPTRLKPAQYNLCNNTPSSRKLLKMGVLTSETCWAVNWHNKISDIKLVYLYSSMLLEVLKLQRDQHTCYNISHIK